jgi:hypothetical protein
VKKVRPYQGNGDDGQWDVTIEFEPDAGPLAMHTTTDDELTVLRDERRVRP